jgi:hypothetical protein
MLGLAACGNNETQSAETMSKNSSAVKFKIAAGHEQWAQVYQGSDMQACWLTTRHELYKSTITLANKKKETVYKVGGTPSGSMPPTYCVKDAFVFLRKGTKFQ